MDSLGDSARLLRDGRRRDRARISKALHDDVGALLTGVAVEIELMRMDAAANGDTRIPVQVKSVTDSLDRAFETIRTLSYDFDPDPAAKFGFYGAVDRLVRCFQRRYPGRLRCRLDRSALPNEGAARVLLEILECTLDNVLEALYSSEVRLSTTRTGGGLTLTVSAPQGVSREFTAAVQPLLSLAAECGVCCEPKGAAGTRVHKVRYRV